MSIYDFLADVIILVSFGLIGVGILISMARRDS